MNDLPSSSLCPQCLCGSNPRPRRTRPGNALVIVPSRRTAAPLTITSRMPSLKWCGSSYVDTSRIEMIDNYRVVEQLDLLEDLDVIRNLDRLAPTREG